MSNYACEGCKEKSVTHKMIRMSPFCFTCQAINNILTEQPKMALILNGVLGREYGVTSEMIKKNMQLPYWKGKFDKAII